MPAAIKRFRAQSTVTGNGRVTVPKEIRDHLGLKAGGGVTFERLPTGEIVLRPNKPTARSPHSAYAKFRGRATVRMTAEDIMALTRGV